MLAAMSFSEIGRPTVAQLRAKRTALLAIAAPTLFTFVGVVLTMLHDPVPDTWLWVACWAIAIALLMRSDNGVPAVVAPRPVPAPLRVAHGVSALALVTIFLALHITNHLMFPAGKGTYDAVMKVFRHVYRNDILQPLVVALFLFQVGTGLFFVWRLTAAPSDRFRTFQIASGVCLAFYVLGHMDSVFIFAWTYLGIDTGWDFATGAPTGLVKDKWNIRLVPHYWLGAFFVLAHLAAGARRVMMAHGVSRAFADDARAAASGASAKAVATRRHQFRASGVDPPSRGEFPGPGFLRRGLPAGTRVLFMLPGASARQVGCVTCQAPRNYTQTASRRRPAALTRRPERWR
jgi:hypothetical protein